MFNNKSYCLEMAVKNVQNKFRANGQTTLKLKDKPI